MRPHHNEPRMRGGRDPLWRKDQRTHHPRGLLGPLGPPAMRAGAQLRACPTNIARRRAHHFLISAVVQRRSQHRRRLPSTRGPRRLHPLCLHTWRRPTTRTTLLIYIYIYNPRLCSVLAAPLFVFTIDPCPFSFKCCSLQLRRVIYNGSR